MLHLYNSISKKNVKKIKKNLNIEEVKLKICSMLLKIFSKRNFFFTEGKKIPQEFS